MRNLIFSLALIAATGLQQQPPVAYPVQLISFPGNPTGVCDIYQVGLNVSNGAYFPCNPTTRSWVAASILGLNNTFTGNNTFSGTSTFNGGAVLGTGTLSGAANLLISPTAPTITSGFNTSGFSITNNGTASFVVIVGTGAGTSTGVLALPAAANSWNCWLTNQTRADHIQQTASSGNSVTFTNYGTAFSATNFTNSDLLRGGCVAN